LFSVSGSAVNACSIGSVSGSRKAKIAKLKVNKRRNLWFIEVNNSKKKVFNDKFNQKPWSRS
jgi:hypothetical protein